MFDFLLSDMDGTLLSPDHTITARAHTALSAYRQLGYRFSVASSRPALGMKKFIQELKIDLPFAAFNGGQILNPDLSVIEENCLATEDATQALAELASIGLSTWVYRRNEWWVTDPDGVRVKREAHVIGFEPRVTSDILSVAEGALKIVGVSLNKDLVRSAEDQLRKNWNGRVQVSRSHASYIDITHLNANKGYALKRLSHFANSSPLRSAAIGDMPNDLDMFKVAGLSIAMGNASQEVQDKADLITLSNHEDGFAHAIETWLLKSHQN